MIEEIRELYNNVDPNYKELRSRISFTILAYKHHRLEMTDEHIAEIRALLSGDQYFLAEKYRFELSEMLTDAEQFAEETEAAEFDNELEIAISEGFTRSQAIDVARKRIKGNAHYLEAKRKQSEFKNRLASFNKLHEGMSQVLNSMSSRKIN